MHTYMELYGYILRMEPVVNHISEINTEMQNLLCMFVVNHHLSIYQIYKIFIENKKISYKNVHKKVQKLIDLKLIEKVTDISILQKRGLERGAKYYKLSEEGIFALFCDPISMIRHIPHFKQAFLQGTVQEDVSKMMVDYRKEIFKNYNNCNFFRLFLYQWISMETIDNSSEDIAGKISNFLNDCCKMIKDNISTYPDGIFLMPEQAKSLLKKDDPEAADFRCVNFNMPDGINNVVDDNYVFYFLRQISSLETQFVKVNRENKNQITISNLDGIEIFQMIYKDKEEEMDIISAIDDNDRISLPATSFEEVTIPHVFFESIVGIIDRTMLFFNAVFSIMINDIKDDDLKILKSDTKFMKKLSELDDKFRSNYDILIR
jgi:hypothetical protein